MHKREIIVKKTSMALHHHLILKVLHFFSLSCLVFAQFSSSPSSQWHSTVSALFILGDSSVNCGNNTFLRSLVPDMSYFYSCFGSETGLLPDLLAEKMGLPKIHPFYAGNGTIEGLLSGLNFGSPMATILNTGRGMGFQALNQQLRQVLETFQILQLQLGHENAQDLIESSLFYISLGKDDYLELFFHDSSGLKQKFGTRGFAHILVNQIIQVIKVLHSANARKIIYMGIGPLGCTPHIRYEAYHSTAQNETLLSTCVDGINEIILEYNTMLAEHLHSLNLELLDAQIVFCDVYQGMMKIITQPELYGFSDVNQACCGVGTFGGKGGCIFKELSCEEPWTHVWWDLYNPTEAVNSLLAEWSWSGQPFNICKPMSIGDVSSSNLKLH